MRRALVILAALLCTHAALADGTEEGRARFQRGVQFYKEGDFRAALIEFRRAYEAAPNYKVLYNLGQTNLELQDYAAALGAFRKYLDDGGKEVPKDRRAQVEGEIKKLEGRVARVVVKTNVDGADVIVDDVTVGKTPLAAPIVVSAGRRKVVVAKAGAGQQTRTIDVAGGDETRVEIEFAPPQTAPPGAPPPEAPPPQPVTVAAPSPSPPPPAAPSGGGPSAATWIGIVATGATGAAAIVTGSLALVSKGQFDTALKAYPASQTDIADARSRTKSFALATDVLGGVAVASAVVTFVLAVTTKGAPKREAAVRLDVGPTGGGVSGSF